MEGYSCDVWGVCVRAPSGTGGTGGAGEPSECAELCRFGSDVATCEARCEAGDYACESNADCHAFPAAYVCNDELDGGTCVEGLDHDLACAITCQRCPGQCDFVEDCAGYRPDPFACTFYPDGDEDGFGAPVDAVTTIDDPPPGHVPNADDCYDENPDVHPGTELPPQVEDRGDGSWDYDCDGEEELEFPYEAKCNANGSSYPGWAQRLDCNQTPCVFTVTIPACGEIGYYDSSGCGSGQERYQACL